MRQAAGPTGERLAPLAQAVLDYGPMPAQAYAEQFGKATDAVAGAVSDPSLSNIGNAGVQTGAAAMSPALMLGGAAIGFGDAAAKDLGFSATSPAAAQQRGRKFVPGSEEEYRDAEDKLARQAFRSPDERRALRDVVQRYRENIDRNAGSQRVLDEERKRTEQAEYSRRVGLAEALRDKELGRDKRFSDTATGQFYERSGGLAPVLGAAGMGALGRFAHGPAGGKALSYAEGVLGAGLGLNAKDLYEGFATQTENPRRRALEEYGLELPAGHPRKQESLDAAQSLPAVNPTQTAALDKLRDPTTLGVRTGLMLLEGTAGPIGAGLVNAPRRIGRDIADNGMFGSKERARREGLAAALRSEPPAPAVPPAGPGGSGLSPSGGALPGPAPDTGRIPQPHPSHLPPGPRPIPAPNPRPGSAPSRSSKYDVNVHTPIARGVIDDYLATGSIPADAPELRAALVRAIEAAGAPMPARRALTEKSAETLGLVRALQGAPEATRSAVLDATLGKGRFLAVPAAGVGASMSADADPQALARALLAY